MFFKLRGFFFSDDSDSYSKMYKSSEDQIFSAALADSLWYIYSLMLFISTISVKILKFGYKTKNM